MAAMPSPSTCWWRLHTSLTNAQKESPFNNLPSYTALLDRLDAPPGSSWGLFGKADQIGTLNWLSSNAIIAASRLIRRGVAFRLDWPLDAFATPIAKHRAALSHVIFQNGRDHRDDYVDHLYLQNCSHIDGLRHMRHHHFGFYNNTLDSAITADSDALGIGNWARRCIVGRGVLLDIERHLSRLGKPLSYDTPTAFPVDVLDDCIESQRSAISTGDILLLRTGWASYVLSAMNSNQRAALNADLRSPGLAQSHRTLEWLWDRRIALLAADNAAVECYPPVDSSPFVHAQNEPSGVHPGMMHPQLIALLGIALGEMWALDELAADCAADGVYEVMIVVNPLNLSGAVGSPANAIAIK